MNTLATVTQSAGADILAMIESNPKLQPTTKAQYRKAITNYLATGASLSDAATLSTYAVDLPKSSRAFLKAAVRLWGDDVALRAKAGATPENVAAIQATVYRIEALNEAIQVEASKGQKAHTWLTQAEVKQLVSHCDASLIGRRDRVVLSLLVGAGLRREELAGLTFAAIKQQGSRTVLEVTGKGAKDRVIPISEKLAAILEKWRTIATDGYIARSVGGNRELGAKLSSVQIFRITRAYGVRIGKPGLAAHDLRRTFAQLGFEAGVPITQLSKLLGHADIGTTQKYLNLSLDLTVTVSDFIPL